MANDKAKLITGLFANRVAAEAGVDALIKHGFSREDISVMMSDSTKNKEFAIETGTRVADGAGIGGALGGAVGAVLAAIAAVGTSIALPGIGLVVAGPIAAALAGAGAGGMTGGLIGKRIRIRTADGEMLTDAIHSAYAPPIKLTIVRMAARGVGVFTAGCRCRPVACPGWRGRSRTGAGPRSARR